MHPLSLLGTVFEGIGLVVAAGAFYRTGRGYGEYPWTVPVRSARLAIGRAGVRFDMTWRRMLRRRRDVTGSASFTGGGTVTMGRAHVRTGFGPIKGLWDHEARLLELADRTAELRLKIEDAVDALQTADDALRGRVDALEARIGHEIELVEKARRDEVLRDSRWQFGGLLLVVFGIVLNGVGQVLQTA